MRFPVYGQPCGSRTARPNPSRIAKNPPEILYPEEFARLSKGEEGPVEKKILRVLIVDDSPDDTELAVAALRQTGCMLKPQRVQDLASMQTALDKGPWDAVISEFSLPHFGAQLALDMIKRANLDIPFIVLTRSIKDSELTKIMRNGAHDVVMKTQTARLAPALERELRVAEERRLYREASQALAAMETKNRAIIDGSRSEEHTSELQSHVNLV